MFWIANLLALAVTATLVASQNSTTSGWIFGTIQSSTDLTWLPCLTDFSCALLDVPLDYAEPCGYRASVPLIKLSAATNSSDGPYQGMILLNPGGPGESGVNFVISTGAVIQQITGTNFDIVSFDPRGIGSSLPSANCSSAPSKVRRGPPKIYGPEFLDSFFETRFVGAKIVGDECHTLIGGDDGAGQHMTTTVNARDMITILDAFARSPDAVGLVDASILKYWGFSYGTFLGQVFANLFPDRIGRVVLDGVVDPERTVAGVDTTSVIDLDKVIATFFVYCHLAGPELCPYYTGTTARDIYLRFEKSFLQLDPRHVAPQNGTNATIIEAVLELAKSQIFNIAYSPTDAFPYLAAGLVVLENILKNGSIDSIFQLPNQSNGIPNKNIWETAVSCTDDGGASFNLTFPELRSYIRNLEKTSVIAGELWSTLRIACTGWSIIGVDRYAGPFGGPTNNPMLFVSNTLDPVTPHVNGRTWTSKYKGAQLLTIEGQGHTSLAAANICGLQKIHDYFQTGELPGKHSQCEQEAGAFNVTLPEMLEKRSDWNDIRTSLRRFRESLH